MNNASNFLPINPIPLASSLKGDASIASPLPSVPMKGVSSNPSPPSNAANRPPFFFSLDSLLSNASVFPLIELNNVNAFCSKLDSLFLAIAAA